jgi:crossover junction endodeoxyribonuclease RusA
VSTSSWEIDVPMVIPCGVRQLRPWTANDRRHWRVKAEWTATIRRAVALRARNLHLTPQEHITVGLHYAPGDNHRRDASNLMTSQKPAVDGLVDARLVPDDTARWVTELMPVLHPGKRPRRLWLVITAAAGQPDTPVLPPSAAVSATERRS